MLGGRSWTTAGCWSYLGGDTDKVVPKNTYGMTKACGELLVNDYTRTGAFACNVRSSHVVASNWGEGSTVGRNSKFTTQIHRQVHYNSGQKTWICLQVEQQKAKQTQHTQKVGCVCCFLRYPFLGWFEGHTKRTPGALAGSTRPRKRKPLREERLRGRAHGAAALGGGAAGEAQRSHHELLLRRLPASDAGEGPDLGGEIKKNTTFWGWLEDKSGKNTTSPLVCFFWWVAKGNALFGVVLTMFSICSGCFFRRGLGEEKPAGP